ncbi:hypothetical protein OO013_15615 [Mangrovivirga sp. M17]|uniref:YceK/YidQ family lipoprotein n=1 Tax=Mangrovivirga halotolerans TaxID=2993936 RepID=A0ABT3RUJ6_9BACT|nr:hypothetical protein [Mangrovivirga halotolerans]MCX2745305.1 hypothetical protein [Mangrovivirga halotolerans]
MRFKKKRIVFAFILLIILTLSGCSNMRWGTSAGVSMDFGPNGPRVRPHMDVDLYSGGRF